MNAPHPGPTFVEVPGGALACDHRPGAEPAIVLLHSGIGDRRGFAALIDHLGATRGAVAYDRRGHGDSTATGDAAHVDDLLAVLDQLRLDRVWLVGSSAGGQIALEAAVLSPERVAGVVLLAPVISGAPDFGDDESVARLEQLLQQAGDDIEARVRVETWLWLDGPHGPEGRVTGPGRALLAEMDRTTIAHGGSEHDGTRVADLWNELPGLELPILFVVGDRDLGSIVQQTKEAARRTPHGRYVELPDRAHLPYLEDPAESARLLRDATEGVLTSGSTKATRTDVDSDGSSGEPFGAHASLVRRRATPTE